MSEPTPTTIRYDGPAPTPAPTEPVTEADYRKVTIVAQRQKLDPDHGTIPDEKTIEVRVNPRLSAMTMLRLVGGSGPGDQNYAMAIMESLSDALPASDCRRFQRWATDIDATIPELESWIMQMAGVAAARPTEGRSPSQDGAPATTTGSTEPGELPPETEPPTASAL